MHVPFLSFDYTNKQIKDECLQAFEIFLDKGNYVLSECVNKFESEYSEFNQTKFTVGVSNGLDALYLSLKALNIQKGDEVIIPSNTFIATALAVSYTGAKPVFTEPDIETYNIDPLIIATSITSKTKAIIPVHLYGQACKMNDIMKVAKNNNLFVVEDNAQAHGASYAGKLTGSCGHINATSFYPGKNLGAFGDAGAVTSNDGELIDKVKMLRNYGSEKKYYNKVIGHNMRLDELQAALLSIKLKYLNKWTILRQQIAFLYDEQLKDLGEIILPVTNEEATHVYHLYVIRTKFRNELQQYLKTKNIVTLIHYPVPPYLQEAYAYLGFKKGAFPIAEEIADTCLSLPIWPGMKKEDVTYVTDSISDFFKGLK